MGRPSVGVADWQAFAGHWGVVKNGKTVVQHCGRRSNQTRISSDRTPDFFQGLCSTTTASARSNSDIGTRRGIWDGSTD